MVTQPCHNPERIPKTVWLTVANPDPVQESINVPWVQAEFYDDSVDGAKLGHTYKVLIHLDTLEDYSFASHVNEPRPRTFEWRLGVPDGEDVRAPTLDERRCSRRLPRRRDQEDDEDEGDHQSRRRGRSIWARISCKDSTDVHLSATRSRSISYGSGSHHCALSNNNPSSKVIDPKETRTPVDPAIQCISKQSSFIVPISKSDPMLLEATQSLTCTSCAHSTQLVEMQGSQGEQAVHPVGTLPRADTDFQGRLEDFLAEISTALPQALLPTPPKVHGSRRRKSPPVTSRRSARLASNNPEGAKTSSLALKVLVKKLGLTDPPYASDSQKLASLFK
ncbi:hypothetical protein GUJ93_ZPchr0003g16483 [Zizania palustris]|uniref:Uncharacterized protein n=1 Tax=Zizania palustris TaxID=103762 RepID=A0A8J5RUN3_ZIZPA|nr:hypothetical protein GUJ93_ZPchr0003g16483 [Zizania palustris]